MNVIFALVFGQDNVKRKTSIRLTVIIPDMNCLLLYL